MSKAGLRPQHCDVSQYYFGYLQNAVVTFEDAIKRLSQCKTALCDIAEAIDMAHRIKGNAAMYDLPELGLKAGKVERELRSVSDALDFANALSILINFIREINLVCQNDGKSELDIPPISLVVENQKAPGGSQNSNRALDRKTILLAYNDPWLSDLIASMLEPQFHVTRADSVTLLHQAIAMQKPDLVIFEDTLDGMNGLKLLKEFKSSVELTNLPVYIAFGSGAHAAIAEAISLNVTGFTADKHEILEITTFANDFLNTPSRSVLVVDDDPVVRDLLHNTLTSAGFSVELACDGLEALTYLAENEPDLILLDRFMPRLEGGTVLYEIQNKINLKSIPVLILTAMVNRGEAKSWFERGAADFIPKPFDPEEVLMRVKQHAETKHRVVC